MFINVIPEKCTGCRACELFCSAKQESVLSPALSRIHVIKDEPADLYLPVVCPPCEDKRCLAACPEEGALIIRAETGAVEVVEASCTACSRCMRACGVGAIHFLRQAGRGKRSKATVLKCDQCGGEPMCVQVCEPGALEYLDEALVAGLDGQIVFGRLRRALREADQVLAERGLKDTKQRH